jgi:hypothetical protein
MRGAFGVFGRERGFMAYLVLALGAFLSIGGALSIFHGAGIVEVERGWTGVIAGATALTGGIITIALGLILKTLLDLRPMLVGHAKAPTLPAEVPLPHDFDNGPHHTSSPGSENGEPTASLNAEFENDMLAAILAPTEPVLELERPFGAPAERPKARPLPVADVFDPSQPDRDPGRSERDTAIDNGEPEPPHPEPVAEKSRFKIGFKKQTPALPLPEPTPVAAVEPDAPAMDDWLDPAAAGVPHEEAALQAELVSAVAEAIPEPVHETEQARPQPPPPRSAVIGRYEADGTSYVMYADGSIEAQSDAGVYRFNSMTELKAFIENAEA